MIRCTIGVMAYNEEQNIVAVLHALLHQRLVTCVIAEILVVASGCTDNTVDLAQGVARDYPIITVDAQPTRAGKAAAINSLIERAQGEVIVLVGADTLPDPDALEHLLRPFADPKVGMTGARVVPLNDPRTFLGFAVQLLWHTHHLMALRWPKLGELVAFRNVVPALPTRTATDEVALEALISAQGYDLVYAPRALVYNYGPETLSDFLLQRRRIFTGHLHIATVYQYVAASLPGHHLLLLAFAALKRYPGLLHWLLAVALLECFARMLGQFDVLRKHSHSIWRPVGSTKHVQRKGRNLALLMLYCRPGSIDAHRLLHTTDQPAPMQGSICWWDEEQNQILVCLPEQPTSELALRRNVAALADYISDEPRTAVMSYRLMSFSPLSLHAPLEQRLAYARPIPPVFADVIAGGK